MIKHEIRLSFIDDRADAEELTEAYEKACSLANS